MSNRSDGKTNFSVHKFRTFNSTISHSNHFQIYEIIKSYLSNNTNKKRIIIKPSLSKEDIYDHNINTFVSSIRVSGYILDDNINDNDIFEALYLFFEYIFLQLDIKELYFIYNNLNEDPSERELIYKIFKNEKKAYL